LFGAAQIVVDTVDGYGIIATREERHMAKITLRPDEELKRRLAQRAGEESARAGKRVSEHTIIIRALERELARKEK